MCQNAFKHIFISHKTLLACSPKPGINIGYTIFFFMQRRPATINRPGLCGLQSSILGSCLKIVSLTHSVCGPLPLCMQRQPRGQGSSSPSDFVQGSPHSGRGGSVWSSQTYAVSTTNISVINTMIWPFMDEQQRLKQNTRPS